MDSSRTRYRPNVAGMHADLYRHTLRACHALDSKALAEAVIASAGAPDMLLAMPIRVHSARARRQVTGSPMDSSRGTSRLSARGWCCGGLTMSTTTAVIIMTY